jgi:preprotein translocase subunit SecE
MPDAVGTDAGRMRDGVEIAPQGAYLPRNDPETRGAPMANPLLFLQQVRSEVGKVVWPTRREVLLTTIMVFIMAALTSVFFFLVDLTIKLGLTSVLGFFG